MADYADDNEQEAAGDPEVDLDKIEEVAELFESASPMDALTALYGDDLEVPA